MHAELCNIHIGVETKRHQLGNSQQQSRLHTRQQSAFFLLLFLTVSLKCMVSHDTCPPLMDNLC